LLAILVIDTLDASILGDIASSQFLAGLAPLQTMGIVQALYAPTVRFGNSSSRYITSR